MLLGQKKISVYCQQKNKNEQDIAKKVDDKSFLRFGTQTFLLFRRFVTKQPQVSIKIDEKARLGFFFIVLVCFSCS